MDLYFAKNLLQGIDPGHFIAMDAGLQQDPGAGSRTVKNMIGRLINLVPAQNKGLIVGRGGKTDSPGADCRVKQA